MASARLLAGACLNLGRRTQTNNERTMRKRLFLAVSRGIQYNEPAAGEKSLKCPSKQRYNNDFAIGTPNSSRPTRYRLRTPADAGHLDPGKM